MAKRTAVGMVVAVLLHAGCRYDVAIEGETTAVTGRDAAIGDASSRDASISDASISDASISDASISDASISDASISDASISDASISDASISDSGLTILPAHLPVAVHEPAVAFDGTTIWVFGGMTSSGFFSDQILKFDLTREEIEVTPYRLPFGLQASAAIGFQGFVYIFGGRRSNTLLSNRIIRFEPATGLVAFMNGRLPSGRYNFAVAASSTQIFLFGGFAYNGSYAYSGEILSYDPSLDTVTTVNATLQPARQSPIAVPVGDQVYLVGGDGQPGLLTRVDRFDTRTGRLFSNLATMPRGLEEPGPMVIDGIAYEYGGNMSSSILWFDPLTLQSGVLPDVTIAQSSYEGRGSIGIPGRGYLFGGADHNGSTFDTIVRFIP